MMYFKQYMRIENDTTDGQIGKAMFNFIPV